MDADLERVIALQKIDSAVHEAERRLADEPEQLKSLEARLEHATQTVATAKDALVKNHGARREIEKDVAVHQGRLSKFRDQAMAVKTNQEYHAIQHEIAFAQTEIKKLEDRILELMVDGDDLTAAVKRAEGALAAEQKAVEAGKKMLVAAHGQLNATVGRMRSERQSLVGSMNPRVLAVFDLVSNRRNGVAVAEAKDGICTICHVRLRPQVFNTVRRNDEIVQCDSCLRILFFVPPPVPSPVPSAQ